MSYLDLALQYPIVFNILVLFASLAIVIKAADLLITGAVGFSQKFGLSDYVTGFLIIGIGTSLPEFIASVMGSTLDNPGIVFGTVLGSAVVTVTLVLGIEAVVGKSLPVQTKLLGTTKYFIPALMALPIFLVRDGLLSRLDGAILLACFLAYLVAIWRGESGVGTLRHVKLRIVWKDMFVYLGAFVALILGARFLVFSSIITSTLIGIPTYLIAIFVIGIGASVGDLMVDLQSIRKGHKQVAVGDVLSGLVVEMLFILGAIAVFKPLSVDPAPLLLSSAFAVIPLAAIVYFVRKEVLRWHGIILIGLFALFAVLQVLA